MTMPETPVRRLRRSRADRVLGGVCGGLGRYFGVDPVLLRIAAVALALATGVLAYLIAWAAVPDDDGEPMPDRPRPGPNALSWYAGLVLITLGAVLMLRLAVPWIEASVAWPLLDGRGVPVPWRALPAAALIVVGLVVVALRRVPGALAALATVLLLAAVVAALPVERYAGPIGARKIAPAVAQWPVDTTVGVGTLTVDLTGRELPADGRMDVTVGVGKPALTVPSGAPVHILAAVGAGDIRVDGRSVSNGVEPRWPQPAGGTGAAVRVDARVGT
ncbi:phage shock protein PspC (stress-responsive transcriptional regulator) [Actinoplanes campanulatus]|uniref:Phage shock protein PspC (Stress-responsive transcriptional regulator) n=1 Tax=Actinoplanes campanulatus TaxID=113559 RepID=A0A7W5ASB3_9ACTN|nr:PspC domain-containing protein [Actinoplanes campanulatus]MBB3101506.1 phage shock protein PspC (stress-responsive transcriptional regulator) [Actinoplanes campanulatus]GGN50534.1 hypothetical protein GCM10010109_89760 [Actinoplanes campanulatus]GID42102.1 hypothetical protein Aca09nite_86080 [Actinoplanes campanulatus]